MDVEAVNNSFYKMFFVLFWYFSVVIGINLVVAYVLDMYGSVERLEDEREKAIDQLKEESEPQQL